MNTVKSIALLMIAALSFGCESRSSSQRQEIKDVSFELIEAADSKSGLRELKFSLEAMNPVAAVVLRFEATADLELESIVHSRDATTVRFVGDSATYSFDYSTLLSREISITDQVFQNLNIFKK